MRVCPPAHPSRGGEDIARPYDGNAKTVGGSSGVNGFGELVQDRDRYQRFI